MAMFDDEEDERDQRREEQGDDEATDGSGPLLRGDTGNRFFGGFGV
jgi:hypothetical protein